MPIEVFLNSMFYSLQSIKGKIPINFLKIIKDKFHERNILQIKVYQPSLMIYKFQSMT